MLFCHAIPTNDEDIFTPLTSDAVVATYFEGTQQRTVICGHTHVQFERRLRDLRILNAGSVSMPFADENVRKIPTAQEAMEFLEALAQKTDPLQIKGSVEKDSGID
ncbi:metallophosphoesterase family protein [Brevibacillus brevis]|uniref:metallophosphoesterase family protein n=1 Tax=Brevibacillus brevis TaxID=1393 RepID=UPI0021BD624B|nr:metallophosphoesterase family protein [Brevibacillus brevis]